MQLIQYDREAFDIVVINLFSLKTTPTKDRQSTGR